MARLRDIVIDAAHPASLARFWAAALDGYAVAPYDDAELARLAANGITDPEDDPTVLVEPTGPGPRLWCQRVPERRRVKNRVHLDMTCADRDAEADRLAALGARVVTRYPTHLVLADPEGNEFCLFGTGEAAAG
ncbi:VOC family protein [Streptomyces sp. NBRC 109706]|uniref:VOC family protein n=1 Tax=Streptomyces sp. NBRC 109706 TaxID=1550035 RepID=UPI00078232DC|nr:VOC family protein [Streptomyces sp. NBRC 109706]